MSNLEIGENGEVVRDVEPAIAFQAGIGLIKAGVLIICSGLRIQLQIDAVPLPQGMCP